MSRPTRVLLRKIDHNPDREEIALTDRVVGEGYFAPLGLQYGGDFIAEGTGGKAASWIVPEEKVAQVIDHLIYNPAPEGYQGRMDVRLLGQTTNSGAKYV